jgi:hypothetical protein
MNTLSMAISPSGSQHVEAELTKRDVADPLQINHASLGRGVALDVALCGRQRSVSGQLLNVAQAAACLDDLLGRSGDKRAAARMRAGAGKAEVLIEPMKPHLNSAGAHARIALAVDDMVGRVRIEDGLQRHQGVAQFGAKPDRQRRLAPAEKGQQGQER